MSFEELLELGKGKEPEVRPPKPEDYLCIMYTRRVGKKNYSRQ